MGGIGSKSVPKRVKLLTVGEFVKPDGHSKDELSFFKKKVDEEELNDILDELIELNKKVPSEKGKKKMGKLKERLAGKTVVHDALSDINDARKK